MVRSFNELNKLEKIGVVELLKTDGWNHCTLSHPKTGDRKAMTKKLGGHKDITVELEHFQVDED